PTAKAEVIGQPLSLQVQPETITLTGPRDRQQIVVTGRYADGSVRDLTPFCELAFETAEVAQVEDGGFVLPQKTGSTPLLVKVGGQTTRVPVTVQDLEKPQ